MAYEFNEKDAGNLQRVKDAMADKAAGKEGVLEHGPDAAAAAALAALLDAETRRHELTLKTQGKSNELPVADMVPTPRLEETPWTQKVLGDDNKAAVTLPS